MDLSLIRKYIAIEDFDSLKRNDEINNLYNIYKQEILKEWVSIEDVAKVKFLGASVLENTEGLKRAHFEGDVMRYSLQKNEYPYDVEQNIKHLVLWSLQPIDPKEIDLILEKELSARAREEGTCSFSHKDYKDLCWFEQTIDQKSVKGVWHVHVFVEY